MASAIAAAHARAARSRDGSVRKWTATERPLRSTATPGGELAGGRHLLDHRAPRLGLVDGLDHATLHELQAVEPGEEQSPPAEVGVQERRRPSGDDADADVVAGQAAQGVDHAGERDGRRRVVDDGSEGAVEVGEHAGAAGIGPEGRHELGDRQ